ncbi:putative endo-polygalacturonase [Dioscorea sansibarensis]
MAFNMIFMAFLAMNMVRTSLCKDFVVTDYGAIPDGKTESRQAFLEAWNESCAYNGSARFVIPKGTFYVYPVTFAGPCYNHSSPKVVIQGTLNAPSSLDRFPKTKIAWLEFRVLSKLVINGGGVIDGQGAQVWPCVPHCGAGRKSNKMPIVCFLLLPLIYS